MATATPFISVITPVKNGARWIEGCLANVASQGYPRLEHIVVDGNSSDGTPDVVRRGMAHAPHLTLMTQTGTGQSRAMNEGIAAARGPILGFLNVDDFYEPGTLNRAAAVLAEMPEPAFVAGNLRVVQEESKPSQIVRPTLDLPKLLGAPSVFHFPWNPAMYFYSKSLHDAVGPYDEALDYNMDADFLYRALAVARTRHVDEVWGTMRYLPGSKTYQVMHDPASRQRKPPLVWRYFCKLPIRQRVQASAWWARAQYWSLQRAVRRPTGARPADTPVR